MPRAELLSCSLEKDGPVGPSGAASPLRSQPTIGGNTTAVRRHGLYYPAALRGYKLRTEESEVKDTLSEV